MRDKLLLKLDNWCHKDLTKRDRFRKRICDAYQFYVSGGLDGRRLWPLTAWKYEPSEWGLWVARSKPVADEARPSYDKK